MCCTGAPGLKTRTSPVAVVVPDHKPTERVQYIIVCNEGDGWTGVPSPGDPGDPQPMVPPVRLPPKPSGWWIPKGRILKPNTKP